MGPELSLNFQYDGSGRPLREPRNSRVEIVTQHLGSRLATRVSTIFRHVPPFTRSRIEINRHASPGSRIGESFFRAFPSRAGRLRPDRFVNIPLKQQRQDQRGAEHRRSDPGAARLRGDRSRQQQEKAQYERRDPDHSLSGRVRLDHHRGAVRNDLAHGLADLG